jgi:hypothetical protein
LAGKVYMKGLGYMMEVVNILIKVQLKDQMKEKRSPL